MAVLKRLLIFSIVAFVFVGYAIFLGLIATESILVTLIFMAFPFIFCIFPQKVQETTLGSARLADFMDLFYSGFFRNSGGVLIGKTEKNLLPSYQERVLTLYELPFSRSQEALEISHAKPRSRYLRLPESIGIHTAFIAPTGAGKSTAHAITNLLTDPSSAIVLDFKGELLRDTALARTMFGDVVCIAPFGLPPDVHFPISNLNPLQLINPSSQYFLDDAAAIANSLVVRQPNEHQPFFNDSSELLIKAVLAMLLTEASPEECTLSELRSILVDPDKLLAAAEMMTNRPSAHPVLMKQLANQITALQARNNQDVMSTVNTHLNWLDSSPVGTSLSETSFKPGKLLDKKHGLTIYIHIPVHRIAAYRGYIRTLFTSLINFIFHAGESQKRRPVRFYLDESYGLGPKLDSLYSALIYGRSYGIRLCFYFQALTQLEEVFEGHKAKDFLSNVLMSYTGIGDMETAKHVSDWIGRHTIYTQTRQQGVNIGYSKSQNNRSGETIGWSVGRNASISHQQHVRELLQAEEILKLPKQTTIITAPHMPPILARPAFYYEDATLKKFVEKSRIYASPKSNLKPFQKSRQK